MTRVKLKMMSPLLRRRHSSPSRAPAPVSNTSTMSSKTLTKMSNTSTLSANTPTSCNNIAPTTVNQGPTKPCLTSCVSVPALKSGSFSFRPRYVKNCYFCEHDDTAEDKVTTYITWVNNQLARGTNTNPITNLERGISDGVTLPQLLQILGDDPVADVVVPPKTDVHRKQNIRLCFQYLQQRHIHPRNSTASDVWNGNVKCIMRLLLALAANFKTYRPESRSVRYMSSISEPACNGGTANEIELGDGDDMSWMYDQVIDTRKQLESLKHLLLKDITDDEKVLLDEAGVELTAPTCTSCHDTSEKIKGFEDALETRDQQVLELKAEILHLKTRDKYLTNELDERNVQVAKLKLLLERKQAVSDSKGRMEKKSWNNTNNANSKITGAKHTSPYTKILYYLGNSTTPYLSTCPKPLGEITLDDFKSVVNRAGRYRYNFRSFDRDVGPVKQELSDDGAVLPGWEGRIVGFVEELPPGNSLDHIEI